MNNCVLQNYVLFTFRSQILLFELQKCKQLKTYDLGIIITIYIE